MRLFVDDYLRPYLRPRIRWGEFSVKLTEPLCNSDGDLEERGLGRPVTGLEGFFPVIPCDTPPPVARAGPPGRLSSGSFFTLLLLAAPPRPHYQPMPLGQSLALFRLSHVPPRPLLNKNDVWVRARANRLNCFCRLPDPLFLFESHTISQTLPDVPLHRLCDDDGCAPRPET